MNRDYKSIFESYRLVREQQGQNSYLTLIVNAINTSKDIAPDVKKKMVEYVSTPANADGLKAAIEGGENELGEIQTGQAWNPAEMPAQEGEAAPSTPYQEPTKPSGNVYDAQGNLVKYDEEGNIVNPGDY